MLLSLNLFPNSLIQSTSWLATTGSQLERSLNAFGWNVDTLGFVLHRKLFSHESYLLRYFFVDGIPKLSLSMLLDCWFRLVVRYSIQDCFQ